MMMRGKMIHAAFAATTMNGYGAGYAPKNSSPRMMVTFVSMTEAYTTAGIRIHSFPFEKA
jgi:hypothetical protein